MSFRVRPLSDRLRFGSVVSDLDLALLEDPEVQRSLKALWVERGVIVFEGMTTDESGHVALSSIFGTPEVHPLRDPAKPGRPELSDIKFDSVFGEIYEFADRSRRGAWLPWHFDLVYTDRINHGGILRPIVVPEQGGETGFIDQIAAYAALPDRLKKRIDGLDVIYRFDIDASRQRYGATPGLRMVRMDPRSQKLMDTPGGFPEIVHPLVFEQPETGRKVLNVSPWFALGVEGMDSQEGAALLEEVIAMMHCALGVPDGTVRHLQRTTILGDYGRGRLRVAGTTVDDAIRVNV